MENYYKNIDLFELRLKTYILKTNLKHIELNALPVYDDKYIKTKLRTYGDRFSTNFRGLNVPEDDIEREPFADLSVDSCMRKQILP